MELVNEEKDDELYEQDDFDEGPLRLLVENHSDTTKKTNKRSAPTQEWNQENNNYAVDMLISNQKTSQRSDGVGVFVIV